MLDLCSRSYNLPLAPRSSSVASWVVGTLSQTRTKLVWENFITHSSAGGLKYSTSMGHGGLRRHIDRDLSHNDKRTALRKGLPLRGSLDNRE